MRKTYVFIATLVLATVFLAGCGGAVPAGKDNNSIDLRQNGGQDNGQGVQKKAVGPDEENGEEVQMKNGGVPPEAVTACQEKNEGDDCEMTLRRDGQKIAGTCKLLPDANQLSCVPRVDNVDQPQNPDQPAPPQVISPEDLGNVDPLPEQQ